MSSRAATLGGSLAAGLAAGLALLLDLPAHAQQAADALPLVTHPIALPGVGRVVFAFVLVAGLAVGTALALRRFGPKLMPGALFAGAGALLAGTRHLRVLERLRLSADLQVHLLQTEHGQVLITAHRHSIAVVVLDSAARPGGQV